MTLSEIYFNYNQAIQQAGRLETVAKNLKKAANDTMEGILNDINSAWKSDSAPQYMKKGQKVEGDILTTAGNIENVAQAIRVIAERIKEAELEAWRIANARN